MVIRLPGCWPISPEFSFAHWERDGTHHGPKSRPRLMACRIVRLAVSPPSTGWRLWIYFRGGYAFHCGLTIDRRSPAAERESW